MNYKKKNLLKKRKAIKYVQLILLIIFIVLLIVYIVKNNDSHGWNSLSNTADNNNKSWIDRYWLIYTSEDYLLNDELKIWNIDVYWTWYLINWNRKFGEWIYYFENGQIAARWEFYDWKETWERKFYYPTYWNYIYHMSWWKLIEEYMEKPKIELLEKEPSWWIARVINFKNGKLDWAFTAYDIMKNRDNESIELERAEFENDKIVREGPNKTLDKLHPLPAELLNAYKTDLKEWYSCIYPYYNVFSEDSSFIYKSKHYNYYKESIINYRQNNWKNIQM